MEIPDQSVFAEYADFVMRTRTDWDMLHELHILHWDGARISVGSLVMIDGSIPPRQYPTLMADQFSHVISEQMDADKPTLYGVALVYEGFAVIDPGDSASVDEREAFERDRVNRALHTRPDAREVAMVVLVDVHQRLWEVVKERASGQVRRSFYPTIDVSPTGRLLSGLRLCMRKAEDVLWKEETDGGR